MPAQFAQEVSKACRTSLELGFFSPLAGCLLRPSQGLRLATLDVLVTTVHHEPSMLRGWILQQRPECELLHALLRCVVGADATGERPQVSEVLRALLDPEGMDGREQDEFLNLFYEDCVHKLAAPVAGKVSAGTARAGG